MASTSEATIGSNLTSLDKLIAKYTEMGAAYNPGKDSQKLPALITLKTTAALAHKTVGDREQAYSLVAAGRDAVFAPLDKLVTRCLSGIQNSDALDITKDRAKTLADKIRGVDTSTPPPPPAPGEPEADGYSTRQLSYGMIAENFGLFIEILRAEPTYLPGSDDIKLPALDALLATMLAKNLEVEPPLVAYKTALSNRNNIFFAPKTGLVDIALGTKKAVLADFGTNSPEYAAVKGIKFVRLKKKKK